MGLPRTRRGGGAHRAREPSQRPTSRHGGRALMAERDDERMYGHVVVGTAPGEAARSAIRYAAREARARRAPLELVRVVPEGPAVDPLACDLLEDGRRHALSEAPGVEVTLSLLTDHGVERLVEQALHAQ